MDPKATSCELFTLTKVWCGFALVSSSNPAVDVKFQQYGKLINVKSVSHTAFNVSFEEAAVEA